MNDSTAIVITGISMFLAGLMMFYAVDTNVDDGLVLKHAGTFVGLAGIGVIMAGILLALMGKRVPISE